MMRMKPDAGHSNTKNDCKERGGPKGPPKQRSNKILDLSTIFLKLLYERLQVEQSTINIIYSSIFVQCMDLL